MQQNTATAARTVVILLWADWCPHCTSMKPAWDRVKRDKDLKAVKFIEVESKNVNSVAEKDPALFKRMTENGHIAYPMITIVKNNRARKYTNDRDFETMKEAFKPKTPATKKKKPSAKKKSPVS